MRLQVVGEEKFRAQVNALAGALEEAATEAAFAAATEATGFAKKNFRTRGEETGEKTTKSGKTIKTYAALGLAIAERLTSRTGRLRSSIFSDKDGPGRAVIGSNVEYARIHELGGTIQINEHTRLAAKRMVGPKFKIDGEWFRELQNVKAHSRKAYTITMPARPYLRPAIEDHEEELRVTVIRVMSRELKRRLKGAAE